MLQHPPIGSLFPAGGPVPPKLVIGRSGEIDEIHQRLREGMHTMLTGDRRIGKTTVCNAACDRMRREASIVEVEVPERGDASSLLALFAERCRRIPLVEKGRLALRTATPLIERAFEENGIPLDLDALTVERREIPTRAILSLPLKIADKGKRPVILYLDELQRAVDYDDGDQLLGDLVDIYSGNAKVTLLVDGSDERTLEKMLGGPIHFGKLCDRLALGETIPPAVWREGLPQRFAEAGLELTPKALEILVDFGAGRPYATMAAARFAALNSRKLGSEAVDAFEAHEGVTEARRNLEEDE